MEHDEREVDAENTIRPVGHTILVKVTPIEEKSKGGIIVSNNDEKQRELDGRDIGEIVSMGPLAYRGYRGAIDLNGPQDWGVKIGDNIEFRRYDGKIPRTEGYKNYRWLNDEDVIGVINSSIDSWNVSKLI